MFLYKLEDKLGSLLAWPLDIALLGMRLFVANAFFKSGLNKYQSFDTTIFLFEHEYKVPLLSPEWAAYLGTAAELILPVLVCLGLFGRLSGSALFLFNIVAVISYPSLWDNANGMLQHLSWGLMLLVLAAYGPGRLSVDGFFRGRQA